MKIRKYVPFASLMLIFIISITTLSCGKTQEQKNYELISSGEWCYTDYYLTQWQKSFQTRRIQECLDAGSARRVHCLNSCTNNPDSYGLFINRPAVNVCYNTQIYSTQESILKCVVRLTQDCINGCLGLSKQ